MIEKDTHYILVKQYFKKDASKVKGYYSSNDKNKIKRQLNKRYLWDIYNSALDDIISKDPNISNVIDIACGMGSFTFELVNRGQFKEIFGLDILKETINVARDCKDIFGNVNFIQGNMLDIPIKNNSIDLSICLNTLHHIHKNDFSKAVNELSRITKKYIVIEIRNKNNFFEFWYNKFIIPYLYKNLPQFSNSLAEVEELMEKNNFELQKIKARNNIIFTCRRLILVFKRKDSI